MFRVIYMYVCPICKKRLRKLDNVWHCQNGHSFDIARKGYVNLLTTKGRNPIDSGCGEGFYTVNYAKALPKAKFYGIDISKAAVAHCMTRIHCENITNCEFAVASSFQLPFIDKFADLIVCTFAPVSNDDYARVLKDGGKLVVVSPSPRHLFVLKEVLYEKPYENKPNVYGLNKFDESEEMIFEYPVVLESQEDIFNLFTMTPYYYKTSAEAVEKLKKVNRLELTCGFSIRTFTKKRGF